MACSFSWDKLVEMKDKQIEFWAADGVSRLKILDLDQRIKTIYLVCIQTGKVTWPLKYQRLEKLHQKIKKGEIALDSHEFEKLIPTWGNYLAGLLNYLGCQEHLTSKERR